ncbi:hypothetical protein BKA80DRAFT_261882 [Phyllosticta citrichinensis]
MLPLLCSIKAQCCCAPTLSIIHVHSSRLSQGRKKDDNTSAAGRADKSRSRTSYPTAARDQNHRWVAM